ncbi:hypothetical protein DVH05_017797 [Phytophthora capsici]|nr:hypothetical protein DVH05_017797 [Phytophthora capsici]
MHLLRLVVACVVALAVVSNAAPASATLVHDATLSGNEATRELTGLDEDEEERGRGGGGGRGGKRGGRRSTGGYYGTNTHLGFWNTNHISESNKECIEFVNWVKRRFNKNIKKCPNKEEMKKYVRHLRA